jgi:hypothetical protein
MEIRCTEPGDSHPGSASSPKLPEGPSVKRSARAAPRSSRHWAQGQPDRSRRGSMEVWCPSSHSIQSVPSVSTRWRTASGGTGSLPGRLSKTPPCAVTPPGLRTYSTSLPAEREACRGRAAQIQDDGASELVSRNAPGETSGSHGRRPPHRLAMYGRFSSPGRPSHRPRRRELPRDSPRRLGTPRHCGDGQSQLGMNSPDRTR